MTDITFRSDITVDFIEAMGDDATVVWTARVLPRPKGADGTLSSRDTGLLNMLMRDRHGTPWEAVVFRFAVHAPVMATRQMLRHRVGVSINEISGRYREMEPVFYIPGSSRNLVQTGIVGAYSFNQGSDEQYFLVRNTLIENSRAAYNRYNQLLDAGIAREVARMVLPANLFSECHVTINLRALLHFLSLRQVTPATTVPTFPQREIEMIAEGMEAAARAVVPKAMELFDKYGRISP